MDFFYVGLSVDPPRPQQVYPLDPHGGPSIGDPCCIGCHPSNDDDFSVGKDPEERARAIMRNSHTIQADRADDHLPAGPLPLPPHNKDAEFERVFSKKKLQLIDLFNRFILYYFTS